MAHFLKVVLILLFSIQIHAAVNPNGGFGSKGGWKPEWTKHFNECFPKYGSGLLANKLSKASDRGQYCDGNAKPQDLLLSILIPLAGKESNYRPNAEGRNGNRVPAGLFQMDSQDMKSHKCQPTGTDPKNPRSAICCAIKIAANTAKRSNSIATGKSGILGSFWQPMREGSSKVGGRSVNNSKNKSAIATQAKKICKTNPTGGGAQTASGNSSSSDTGRN